MDMKSYKWFYDNIESHFYNLMAKWMTLSLGGERRLRRTMIAPVSFQEQEKIL